MSKSTLILHRGAREVTRPELDTIAAPPATATWFPVSHSRVLDTAVRALAGAGFEVARTHLALARDNARFFGLCPGGHKPNCADPRIMHRLSESTAEPRLRHPFEVRIVRHDASGLFKRCWRRWIVELGIMGQSCSRNARRASSGLNRNWSSGVSAKVDSASSFIARSASTYWCVVSGLSWPR